MFFVSLFTLINNYIHNQGRNYRVAGWIEEQCWLIMVTTVKIDLAFPLKLKHKKHRLVIN